MLNLFSVRELRKVLMLMLSKNNKQFLQHKYSDRKQKFAIKKFSVGVASVLIGATFMMQGQASADEIANNEQPTNNTQQTAGTEGQQAESTTAVNVSQQVQATDEKTAVEDVTPQQTTFTVPQEDQQQTTTFTVPQDNFTFSDAMLRESKVATNNTRPVGGSQSARLSGKSRPFTNSTVKSLPNFFASSLGIFTRPMSSFTGTWAQASAMTIFAPFLSPSFASRTCLADFTK